MSNPDADYLDCDDMEKSYMAQHIKEMEATLAQKDAEIARLRGLVIDAYYEGFQQCSVELDFPAKDQRTKGQCWVASESYKALTRLTTEESGDE